jgi:hypothetical protein
LPNQMNRGFRRSTSRQEVIDDQHSFSYSDCVSVNGQ